MGSKSESKTKINKTLRKEGKLAVQEARDIYDRLQAQGRPGIGAEREEALNRLTAMARGGDFNTSVPDIAMSEYEKVMGGGYLSPDSNPFLQDIVNRSVSSSMAAPVGNFAGSGRFGSGAMANAMADIGQQTAANLYGANYQTERDRMMNMLARSNEIDSLQTAGDLRAAEALEGVGRQREAEALAQYQEPMNQLMAFLGALTGNPLSGESSTSSSTVNYGAIAAGLGGAAMNK